MTGSMTTIDRSPHRDAALLIVGHGSTENPDSSDPSFAQAEAIRQRNLFDEVHCAFWKQEPSLPMVDSQIERGEVYVVPNFISEGYFTREVIPRELELTGETTHVRGKTWHYCDPVGIHPRMTDLLLHRARETAPEVDPADAALFIVGHGTALNAKSTEAIREQVRLLREKQAPYAEILDAYMEEEPLVENWDSLCRSSTVIVVPFFISDGLHSYQDIPVLLGLETEPTEAASQRSVFRHNPASLRGRTLYYSRAIGTDPAMVEVILDQVAAFDQRLKAEEA